MKKKVLLILKIFFTILLIISIVGIISWMRDNRKVNKINKNIDDYIEIQDDDYKLKADLDYINKDTVGWIIVKGTNINYPVVQGKDNDYYLNHDYFKDWNSAGWLFMDSNNKLTDQNIVIYGHHRQDGIMFGDIDKLFEEKFYKENDGEIIFIVGDKTYRYKIFSVYKAETSENYNKNNYEDFENHIKNVNKKSAVKFENDLSGVKQTITLSTCSNNNVDRLVVNGCIK